MLALAGYGCHRLDIAPPVTGGTVVGVVICLVAVGPLASRRLRHEERRLADLVAWATAWHWTFDKVGND